MTSAHDDPDQPILLDLMTAVLSRVGAGQWSVDTKDFWCQVIPADHCFPAQGWKVHVSATPLSAPIVLARCATVLIRHGCAFKFAGDLAKVRTLVDRACPRDSGGKFITAYPADVGQFRRITAELDDATLDLHGPKILSDRQLRPGSLVHYRYGTIVAPQVLTNDGGFVSVLTAPDGTTVPDQRAAWFSPPSWADAPFPDAGTSTGAEAAPQKKPESVLLANRFIVRRAVRHANKGGVYLGHDTIADADVIIKHARRHVDAGLDGTDSRDHLRHEAEMLDAFAALGIVPRKIALFEQQGDLFLAEELIPGVRLEKWASARSGRRSGNGFSVSEVIGLAARLIDVFATAQRTGLVLRDFNPNNLMVTPDEEFRLIDLEFAVRPGAMAAGCATPAYAAPEQAAGPRFGQAPGQEADLFSLGATLFYLVTGTHPLFPADVPAGRGLGGRLAELIALMAPENASLAVLAPLIRGLMDSDPARRWPVADAREYLAGLGQLPPGVEDIPAPRRDARLDAADLNVLIDDGLGHILRTATSGEPRLWASGDAGSDTDPCNVHHGAAGILAVLTRAARAREHPGLDGALALDEAVDFDGVLARTAGWIDKRLDTIPRILPGLYFGRSGTAWALHDAAVHLGDERMASRAIGLAEQVPIEGWGNPDVCHGLAGAGLAHLHLWQATRLDSLRARAMLCAEAVLSGAQRRGAQTLWPIPASFDSSLAGLEHYGFAHGVAGAGAFLLYAAAANEAGSQDRFLTAAVAAGHTLCLAAQRDDDSAWWPVSAEPDRTVSDRTVSDRTVSDRDDQDGAAPESATPDIQHWCSGASGIGTFLIRLWLATGTKQFLEAAEQAAVTVHRRRWDAGNSICHGLAGDGEFLLDMAQFTGQQKYLGWAYDLAGLIYARRVYLDGLAVIFGDDPVKITADYSTGSSGVLGFLLRLRDQGPRPWLPDALLQPLLPLPSSALSRS